VRRLIAFCHNKTVPCFRTKVNAESAKPSALTYGQTRKIRRRFKTGAVNGWGQTSQVENRACHLRQAQLFPNRLWGVGVTIEHSLQLSSWVEELPHNQQSSSRSKLKFGMD
jgi:hypothetical protein